MTGTDELATYVNGVPGICEYCGGPSKLGVKVGPFLSGTVAVCGIVLAIAACCACGVPATDGNTAAASDAGGICANPGGIALLGTKVHGPVSIVDLNQRPASST